MNAFERYFAFFVAMAAVTWLFLFFGEHATFHECIYVPSSVF